MAHNAGVIKEDVEFVIGCLGHLHHVGTIGGFGHVGVDIGGLTTGTSHQGNGLRTALVVNIHYHNCGPFLGKEQGRFTTNATTTTGDQGNFIL